MSPSDIDNGFLNRDLETRDWESRKKNHETRFLSILSSAFKKSRAYSRIYKDMGIDEGDINGLNDLEKLPLLRINDLVERQKKDPPFGGFEIIEQTNIRRIYINPGFILQPGYMDFKDTSWAEALCGAGFKKMDRVINTFNYHMWPYAFILDESAKMIGAYVIPTGVGNTLMQVKIMQKLKVNGFMGTPSFLMTLAQRAQTMGIDPKNDLNIEKAFVGAEMLPESLRSRLEKSLEITVRQAYGTVFIGCVGYECEHKTGLHVPDNVIIEIVDPKTGQHVVDGAVGEIVATNFNESYPMIRMATGDLSLLSNEKCPCGRTGPVLKKILGRTDQAAKVRGTFIHPWQTDEVVSRHPEIFKYQVVITREEHKDIMTFMVELKDETQSPDRLMARMERDIKDLLTIKGVVRIIQRGTIPDFHKKIEDRRSWE